jgi:hypothetical protein
VVKVIFRDDACDPIPWTQQTRFGRYTGVTFTDVHVVALADAPSRAVDRRLCPWTPRGT